MWQSEHRELSNLLFLNMAVNTISGLTFMASCSSGTCSFFQKHYLNIYSLSGYCSSSYQCGLCYNSGVQEVKNFHNNTKMISAFFNLSGEYSKV